MKNDLKELLNEFKKDTIDSIKNINWFKQLQLFLIFIFTVFGTFYIMEHKTEFLELTFKQNTMLLIQFILAYMLTYILIKTISFIIEYIVEGLKELYHEYKEHKK